MHFATILASPPFGTISVKPTAPGDRMTRYSLSRRIKLSHLSLLSFVDHIALLLGINRLAKCKRSASNFWDYTNTDLKLMQVRFYPTVGGCGTIQTVQ